VKLLLRRTYLREATVGVLTAAGTEFATLEDVPGFGPDHCVPIGQYALVPHDGTRYQGTWALVNERLKVSHWPEPGMRSAILIHAGNTTEDTHGCILVGDGLSLRPRPAITNSRSSFALLLALLGRERNEAHELLIEGD